MIEKPSMLIAGEEVDAEGDRRIPVLNPATGQVLAEIPAGGPIEVDRAVKAAKAAFDAGVWRDLSPHERSLILNRFADRLEDELEGLFRLETLNNGRPVRETRAQLGRLPEWYRYNAALLLAQRTPVIPMKGEYHSYVSRYPLGVCGILTSFNHPLMILSKSLAPALATGNSVVIKSSELTPLTTLRLAQIASESEIPDGVINVVTGTGVEAGAALAQHADVAKLTFTGGTEVGRQIGLAAAGRFARATTELGGKAPVIVFDDIDVETAVRGAAFACFVAAGQTCICGARHLVHESIYDEFVAGLTELAQRIVIGDPGSAETQLGPLISAAARERVLGLIEAATEEGAELRTGGSIPEMDGELEGGFFLAPTVLAGVRQQMRVSQEEIFGPVASVTPFSDEREALTKANDVRFGLGSAIWTRDVARAHRVAEQIEAGMVWVNDHHRLDPASPWGGVKDSGVGREGGWESFDDFTHVRSVTIRTAAEDVDWYGDEAPDRLN